MTLSDAPIFLYDGPMETRIQFGSGLPLDEEMCIFTLVDSAEGRAALSALLKGDGTMLDGTPVWSLIAEIDATVSPRPELYVIGCTHPTVCAEVLALEHPELERILGVKANGSSKPPSELLALDHAEADPPEEFAESLLALGQPRGFRLYGGCCGTDTGLIESLGRRLGTPARTGVTTPGA